MISPSKTDACLPRGSAQEPFGPGALRAVTLGLSRGRPGPGQRRAGGAPSPAGEVSALTQRGRTSTSARLCGGRQRRGQTDRQAGRQIYTQQQQKTATTEATTTTTTIAIAHRDTRTHTDTHTHARTHARTHTHTHARARARARTHARTHAPARPPTHTHTHPHTHAPAHPPAHPFSQGTRSATVARPEPPPKTAAADATDAPARGLSDQIQPQPPQAPQTRGPVG